MIVSSTNREEAIKCEIDIMEKEIIYLTGKRRQQARKAYFKLLNECDKTCGLNEPVYIQRT
jgi:hypothetical protein